MPKRKSGRWEQVIEYENCYAAVCEVLQNRHMPSPAARLHTPNRRDIYRIIMHRVRHPPRPGYLTYCNEHKEEVARQVQQDLMNRTWEPRPNRTKTIMDKMRNKERNLKMPSVYDQFVHHAVLRVMIPDLTRRFDEHSCGSIPGAGQKRATRYLKRWMAKKGKPYKYAASADVRHFYESCTDEAVMYSLEKVYKDKPLLDINRKILDSMGGTLAIGFFPSPWYANLVLDILVDKPIKETFGKDIQFVRFADDMVILGNSKRTLHRALELIQDNLRPWNMRLKGNYSVYRTAKRGVQFLSYRFFRHCTLIRKQVLYRISSASKKVKGGISPDLARRLCSYKGIMIQANSKKVYDTFFKRSVWQKSRRVISYVDKLCIQARQDYSDSAAES